MSAETDLILATQFYTPHTGVFNNATGDFVSRTDAASLAGALLALIHVSRQDAQDVKAALVDVAAERDKLRAAHVPNLEELMTLHGISVWQDPHWCDGRFGTPRWLAGAAMKAEAGEFISDDTGFGSPGIVAKHTASGATPSASAKACAALVVKAGTA